MYSEHRSPWRLPLGGLLAVALPSMMQMPVAGAAEPEPGLEITGQNVDQYAQYMSASMITKAKQGELYKVFATTPVEKLVYPKWLEMTRQNAGKAKMLDEAGTWGTADGKPWPGGFPFPGSKNAREIMANFQYNITSDDIDSKVLGRPMGGFSLIDSQGKEYKRSILNLVQRRMTGRVWVPPLGSEPGYEDELYRTNTIFFEPYDVRGLSTMNIIYRDQAKLPDGYVYVPVLRRVRRLSSSQRGDSIAGSDLTLGDLQTFSDPLGMWDFKLLETKKMLTSINNAPDAAVIRDPKGPGLKAGFFPTPYSAVELRDTHVIEAVPRYDSIYGKKILHIDVDTYRPSIGEFFDRQGKLLKAYHLYWHVLEDFTPMPRWIAVKNMQTGSGSVFWNFDLIGNAGSPLRRVDTANMKDSGR